MKPQSTYNGRDDTDRVSVSAHSDGAYTETLYVVVTIVYGVGVHLPPCVHSEVGTHREIL